MAFDRFFGYTRLLATGAPVGAATISVFQSGTSTLATIFNDPAGTDPKPNPFLADSNGFFFFYVAAGTYDVQFSGGGNNPIPQPYTWGDVPIGQGAAGEHVLATSAGLGPLHTVSGLTVGHVLTATGATTAAFQALPGAGGGVVDHGLLQGLTDDDHLQYPALLGRTGGQALFGGINANETLELDSTLHAAKGNILIAKNGGNVGIGAASPNSPLEVAGVIHSTSGGFKFPDGTTLLTAPNLTDPAWTIVGDDIHNANVDNVGIGQVAPARKLHVTDSLPNTAQLRIESSAVNVEVGLELYQGANLAGRVTAGSAGFRLVNVNGDGVHISQTSGFTHIGDAAAPNAGSPDAPLHVSSTTTTDDAIAIIESRSGFDAAVDFYDGNNLIGKVGGDPTAFGVRSYQAGTLTGELLLRPLDGAVGLGTPQPDARFHVFGAPVGTLGEIARFQSTASTGRIGLYVNTSEKAGTIQPTQNEGVYILGGAGLSGIRVATNGRVQIASDVAGTALDLFGAPTRQLEVSTSSQEGIQIRCHGQNNGSAGIEFISGSIALGRLQVTQAGVNLQSDGLTASEGIAITHAGLVGIGTQAPSEKLDVTGSAHATAFNVSSDKRFKDDVRTLRDHYGPDTVLDRLSRVQGVVFRWNDFYRNELGRAANMPDVDQVGFIAQDLQEAFPELVMPWTDGDRPDPDDPMGDRYLSLYYDRFVAVLVDAVNELRERIEELEKGQDITDA